LSFKPGTDDLRESPLVRLAERLIGKGYDLRIYDRNVTLSSVLGTNKRYIEQVIPHISALLLPDITSVLAHAELVIIGHSTAEFKEALGNPGNQHKIIDLVRIIEDTGVFNENYSGIGW
jgi:GDP-mannose 6-dehydrogenase